MSLAALLLAAAAFAEYGPIAYTLKDQSYGVLLLGEGGGPEWKKAEDEVRRQLKGVPVEAAWGLGDAKFMQKKLDLLLTRRVKAVVGVPLFVSSYGEMMDQNRYLFGVRERPPETLLNAKNARRSSFETPRLNSRVPLMLSKALDDHPLVVETLAARAKALSRGESEVLILVGAAPAGEEERKEWLASVSGLADKVRQAAGLKAARAVGLRMGEGQRERETGEKELREAAKELRRLGKIVVVPLDLAAGALDRPIKRALDGLIAKYDGKTLLPDERLAKWAAESAALAAKFPDMRAYKGLPPARSTRKAGRIP